MSDWGMKDYDYESRIQRNYEAQREREWWHRTANQEPIFEKRKDEWDVEDSQE